MQEKKIKVLFLPGWYPNRNFPMLGNFVQRHAEAASGYADLTVLSLSSDAKITSSEAEITEENVNGIHTVTVYFRKQEIFWGLNSFLNKINAFLSGWNYVIKKYGKPEIVHLNVAFPMGFFALWIKFLYSVPYVVTEHWSGYRKENASKLSFNQFFLSKWVFRNARFILPVTKNQEEDMRSLFLPEVPFKVIPNTVNTTIFHPAEQINVNKKKQILHVSTLDEEAKNVFGLMRAVKNLSLLRQDFELHILHEYYSEAHEKYSRELDLQDRFVFFDGPKSQEEVAETMRRSDFFVLFSNYENLPVVLLESLATGLPVLTTRVGGIMEHITKDFGITIEPKDEKALSDSMNHLLDHCGEYDKTKLREYAVANFSNEAIGKSFLDIYSQVVKITSPSKAGAE